MKKDLEMHKSICPREAAYQALLASLRNEGFIHQKLRQWQKNASPCPKDLNLAREISYGAARMALALDYFAKQCTDKQKLTLKLKEKALVRTALYQVLYMQKVPAYAIINESVKIAKRHCHQAFSSFLNALLRRAADAKFELPQGASLEDLSIRYSYPPPFIAEIVSDYGCDQAVDILAIGNQASKTIARLRPGMTVERDLEESLVPVKGLSHLTAVFAGPRTLDQIAASPSFYIQNATPIRLMEKLYEGSLAPKKILDLCASPGGKLILAHDLYPAAMLHANDISELKLKRVRENLSKYDIEATLSSGPGENFKAGQSSSFDLILLDVPCSNTGVLNKRPEARWRLESNSILLLEKIQMELLENALSLLSDDGEIWYMTCSLLKRENEKMTDRACQKFGLQKRCEIVQLPSSDGWDGGYACALHRNEPSL